MVIDVVFGVTNANIIIIIYKLVKNKSIDALNQSKFSKLKM
jgi:hypothetical protein